MQMICLKWATLTLEACCGCVFQRAQRNRDCVWSFGSVWYGTHFRGSLAQIGPFMGFRIAEAIGHGSFGTIDHTGAARMLDAGYGFLILKRVRIQLYECAIHEQD